ncbi:MAG: hypothetical protein HPY83_03845 [Anaerolineae bacterium]|nr:hypothetical protein [Anaerolineae bacterium]
MKGDKLALWRRWVAANALGELVGLGATGAIAALVFANLGEQNDTFAILTAFVLAVASGSVEATVLGLAQWWAMRPWFPTLGRRSWWLATLAGALIAYLLGYLPSTLGSLGEESAESPLAEAPQWVVLALAAGLGIVTGATLSLAQWLALRRHVRGAVLWVPANALAWMIGMPLIFWGMDLAQRAQALWQVALLLAAVLLAAGAVVGAIHGAFLVRLAEDGWRAGGS